MCMRVNQAVAVILRNLLQERVVIELLIIDKYQVVFAEQYANKLVFAKIVSVVAVLKWREHLYRVIKDKRALAVRGGSRIWGIIFTIVPRRDFK